MAERRRKRDRVRCLFRWGGGGGMGAPVVTLPKDDGENCGEEKQHHVEGVEDKVCTPLPSQCREKGVLQNKHKPRQGGVRPREDIFDGVDEAIEGVDKVRKALRHETTSLGCLGPLPAAL